MKKLLTGILALSLAAAMAIPAFAAENAANNDGTQDSVIPVTGTFTNGGAAAAEVISVDIAWEDMAFVYAEKTDGTWNPETHTYENPTEGGWMPKNGSDPKITVTNHSNAEVAALFSFTSATSDGFYGAFAPNALDLPSAEGTQPENAPTAQTSFSINSGSVTESKDTLGTITVQVLRPLYVYNRGDFIAYGLREKPLFLRLANDVTTDGNLSAGTSSTILDLNGHTLTPGSGGSLSGSLLTVKNGTIQATGQFALRTTTFSSVTLENCTLIGGTSYTVYASGTGTLYLKNCTLNTTSEDGAMFVRMKVVFSGDTSLLGNQYLDFYSGKVICLAGTYNFDPTAYVDADAFQVTGDGSVWTVTAK